ncbi:unnamed protein product [Vitrella brassicaformis CCMP3155]|uniref:Uncharacterized protein n=1 Tax=Vitrella brassicaformis (strain CCMP3155) TaxID=1169540 RepID=A0A0G4EB11_VITBC|nr:unnamed protein product [Vitrella brassicaformis CCMP3155]|eukprot:CEL93119.1 unnamed protein product [Vitrella brassicaformis CCMP3155]
MPAKLTDAERSDDVTVTMLDEKKIRRRIKGWTDRKSSRPPPTLTSLTSITTVTGLSTGQGRHWQVPSLERVHIKRPRSWGISGGWVEQETLGGLVASSRCLKQLQVECTAEAMAESLRCIPVAAAGQPGHLVQLEEIGTLSVLSASAETATSTLAFCVRSPPAPPPHSSCRSTSSSWPPEPSGRPLAFVPAICPALWTHPAPLPAFSRNVVITGPHDWGPDADAEEPDPVVLDSMPENAFPAASSLFLYTCKGHVIARRLLTKMPVVRRIQLFCRHNSTEEQTVGVLQTVGGEGQLEYFDVRTLTGVGEGGLGWGDIADKLPTISALLIIVQVPEALRGSDAAGEFGIACVKSLLKIRGINRLHFGLDQAGGYSLKRLVEERTNGDTNRWA